MSLLDKIARPQRKVFPKYTTFRLTESGRDKVQDYAGDPSSRVLLALETRQSSANIEEIARECRMSVGQVERLIPHLIHAGYVQPASAADSDVF